MAEKGGKGFAASKGKTATKSLPKKQGSLKGKDSAPSKKSKRVLIEDLDSDSEGFIEENSQTSSKVNGKMSSDMKSGKKKVTFEGLKSGGKASSDSPTSKGYSPTSKGYSPTSKGDWDKGGKDFSSGKFGGKGSLPQATAVKIPIAEVEIKLEIELPKNARVLMDCEAADILQGIEEHLTVLSEDPNIKIPESFNKALQYSKINNHYTNAHSARQILETLKRCGVNEGEIGMIGNISPESVDEVYALIPSLKDNKHKNEGPISDVLARLAKFKVPK